MCVCKQTHFKGCTKKTQNPQKTTKKQALNSTIAFPTMVSEPGKLESTMMHRAHNGLTNCSFVSENTPLFYRKHYSVSAITLPGRHAVTDYAQLSSAEQVEFTCDVTSFSISLLVLDSLVVPLLTAGEQYGDGQE